MERVQVNHEFLSEAMQDQLCGIESHRFLDTKTGEVLYFSSEDMAAAEENESIEERLDWEKENIERAKALLKEPDKNRYISIDPISSREAFNHMSEFADTVQDKKFQNILFKSLSGDRPFRRFKDALEYDESERDRWFRFKDEKMLVVMEDWLRDLALEGVELYIQNSSPP